MGDGYEDALKILMTPQGEPFKQEKAYALSKVDHIIILCGHYEGYDERIRHYFDEEISIGDFVVRVIDGTIGKAESHHNDSFNNILLEHPHYTRPRVYDEMEVPEVLLNGHHKKINEWRHEMSLKR